jgi:hypothetical protein
MDLASKQSMSEAKCGQSIRDGCQTETRLHSSDLAVGISTDSLNQESTSSITLANGGLVESWATTIGCSLTSHGRQTGGV